jgi:hypothetical protein
MQKRYALLAMSILLGLAATSANAVSLYDYQEAKPSYTDANVGASFSYDTNKNGTAGNQKDSYRLQLDLDYTKVFSTPLRDVKFGANFNGLSTRSSAGVKGNSYIGDAEATVSNYFKPNSRGAFVYGSLRAEDKKDVTKYKATATVGAGYGRIVDATPMSKAMWMVKELRAQGKLNGDLSTTDYQNLARVISKEEEYANRVSRITDDYKEIWVSDMASAIQASGKVNGSLDAAAVLRLYKIIDSGVFVSRQIGTVVKAGVGKNIQNYGEDKGDALFEMRAEHHRPINAAWQFSDIANVSGTDSDDYDASNTVSLEKQINTRSAWKNSWVLARTEKPSITKATNSNVLSSKYNYALGNRLSWNAGVVITDDNKSKADGHFEAGIAYKLR